MTDPLDDTEPTPPRIIVVMGSHSPALASTLRRLHMMAAMHVIVLAHKDDDHRIALETGDDFSPSRLNRALSEMVLRHAPVDMPMVHLVEPRSLCADYNVHAAKTPRGQDCGMAAKAHLATERMAAKSVRYRHFHY